MKKINTTVLAIILLIICSLIIYILQIFQFASPRDTAFYFFQDMAFLPLQVAIVTIILGKFINAREKRQRIRKTNMMVGAFFSEVGNRLIEQFNNLHNASTVLQPCLKITEQWTDKDFKQAAEKIKNFTSHLYCTQEDIQDISKILFEKRPFLIVMLENPNLLEHEIFTDMLWAVFHLTDELLARGSLTDLPENDITHLNNDVRRAVNATLTQWITYMSHLKSDYPYLFSLEMRRNPFNCDREIIIR